MEIWEYGNMKTTLEVPDDLFREAKVKAAAEGLRLKDVVAEGLRLVLRGKARAGTRRRVVLPLIKTGKPGSLRIAADVAHRLDAGEDRRRHAASL